MDGFGEATQFAKLVTNMLEQRGSFFTLIDVGSSSGIDDMWRVFGDRLRAFAFDPNLEDTAQLSAKETLPGISYVPAFVGLPPEDPGNERMRNGNFWGRDPEGERLSYWRTREIRAAENPAMGSAEKTKLDLWQEVPLADPSKPVVIPEFLEKAGIDDVDFIKIDVDGADFLILRTLIKTLGDADVLGVGIEVNFFGSADPDVHTFHNVDRLMKEAGFELFALSTRPYSMTALPAPYQLDMPAQTLWGRIMQGDALYFRDAGAREHVPWAEAAGPQKLTKLAALFSLAHLPDCAAEILVRYRELLGNVIDVQAGLDALTAQSIPSDQTPLTYLEYIAEFEANSDRFWPSIKKEADSEVKVQADVSHKEDPFLLAGVQAGLEAEGRARRSAEALVAAAEAENNRLRSEIASMCASESWRLTAPFRAIVALLRRVLRTR